MEIEEFVFDPSYKDDYPEADGVQVMTVKEFLDNVRLTAYTDDDGCGHPAVNGVEDKSVTIAPSALGQDIPEGTTHIFWYNK
jgi:hypothetical protein